jgi:hypothetical protein
MCAPAMKRYLHVLVLLAGCDGAPMLEADAASEDAGGLTGDDAAMASDGGAPGTDGGSDAGPPNEDGVWGAPETTFTLPAIEEGAGYYYPDIQARFPEVDWATLDRLYIPAGHYRHVLIGNLPDRDPASPLVITNLGGQVRVGGLDHYYLFSLGGGSGWVMTGRYDPISQTGDAEFPGHRHGAYANSQGTYGILVDDDFVRDGNLGIAVGGGATAFELEWMELCEIGFAGVVLKTDDDASAIMDDVRVHDLYIHDTGSEGFYIGSTQAQPQHTIVGLDLHHNRVLRTGTEAIQIGQLAGDIEVHHNVFGPSAIDWRAAFQRYQDGNLQIGARSGTVDVHHNVFLGGAGSQGSIFGALVEGDTHAPSDRVWIHDNYYSSYRSLFAYVNTREAPMVYRFERNFMRGHRDDYAEVYAGAPATAIISVGTSTTAVEAVDNRFDIPDLDLVSHIADPDGNGSGMASSGSGNTRGTVEPITFRDAGLPSDFDWLELEMWTDIATRGGNVPVTYPRDRIVMHLGIAYRCAVDTCAAGAVPPENPEVWTALPQFPDDVRTAPSTVYSDIGM